MPAEKKNQWTDGLVHGQTTVWDPQKEERHKMFICSIISIWKKKDTNSSRFQILFLSDCQVLTMGADNAVHAMRRGDETSRSHHRMIVRDFVVKLVNYSSRVDCRWGGEYSVGLEAVNAGWKWGR